MAQSTDTHDFQGIFLLISKMNRIFSIIEIEKLIINSAQ
jgi:hypothetical protein